MPILPSSVETVGKSQQGTLEMKAFEFAFEVDGFDQEDDRLFEAIVEVLGDVISASHLGRVTLGFSVEAENALGALATTCAKLREVAPQVRVIRMDRDLVNIPEIAIRTGQSPESIRLYALGKRLDGSFPVPVAVVGNGIWEWAAVANWFEENFDHKFDAAFVDYETTTIFDAILLRLRPRVAELMSPAWHVLESRPSAQVKFPEFAISESPYTRQASVRPTAARPKLTFGA